VGRAVLRGRRRRREDKARPSFERLSSDVTAPCRCPESPPGGRQRSALPELSWRYVEAFETEAAQLYAQAMDLDEMRQFATRLVDVD
jgi:hypothetical protein